MSMLPGTDTDRRRAYRQQQRTVSVDGRLDYSTTTWLSILELLQPLEYAITVDHFSIWKCHVAWAIPDGKDLRDYITQRYSSNMIILSLLLGAELSILFNPCTLMTSIRATLSHHDKTTPSSPLLFFSGIGLIVSAMLTVMGLICTITAWTMVSAVNPANIHAILRSSMGQYVAELPERYIVGAFYSFMMWLLLMLFVLLQPLWAIGLSTFMIGLFVHTITTFSAFGRIVIHSSAMGSQRILESDCETELPPRILHRKLLSLAKANLATETSIRRQYRPKENTTNAYLPIIDEESLIVQSKPPSGHTVSDAVNNSLDVTLADGENAKLLPVQANANSSSYTSGYRL